MGDFKVFGIIIILLCDGVQNTELKAPHFLNLFERVLQPSPPLFESPSLRRPQEWASAFRNYWSSLIRNRLPIIGWGTSWTEEPHREELEHTAEDMKHMDIDAPIVTEKHDTDTVSYSVVPVTITTPVEKYDTHIEVTEVTQPLGATDMKFSNTPPVKTESVPYANSEIPLHPPAASYPNHGIQTSTQTPKVPTKQPSLLEILLEDFLCKSSSQPNCEHLINIKYEQYPGKPHSSEHSLVLKVRRPVVNNEKKVPHNTPTPYYHVNIKDILGPETYTTVPLKDSHYESNSYTPTKIPEVTSYTTEKQMTTNAATTAYTPLYKTKQTTQAAYTTTPAKDKTTSYPYTEIPEVTSYITKKEATSESTKSTYFAGDLTEHTSKASYTTLPNTEKHHDSSKVSSYTPSKEVITTRTPPTPSDVIKHSTNSYTTVPTTEYHKDSTYSSTAVPYHSTHPPKKEVTTDSITTPHTKVDKIKLTSETSYTTTPATEYHKDNTYSSTAIPYRSTNPPKKEVTTYSTTTPHTKVDKIELISQTSYTTTPTTKHHYETSSHTPGYVKEVSTQEQTTKIPIRNNDRLTNLNSPKNPIKHSSQTSHTTVTLDKSKYTSTTIPDTSTHVSYTAAPQFSTAGITSSYAPGTITKLIGGSGTEKYPGVYATSTPSSEGYSINSVENTNKFTADSPYSESTVTLDTPEASLSELLYDRPLKLSLNDNSDQQIEDVPKKQTHPTESIPPIAQPPYIMPPNYAPSYPYSNIPYPLQWNYRNEFQTYPYSYYYPRT